MAGWTMVEDEQAEGCGKVKQKIEVDEFWADLKMEVCEVRDLFDRFIHLVSEDIVVSGSCIRPLPPRLGDGKCVDLFRVFVAVRKRGGFETVTDCGLWNLVGVSCGLGCGVGVPLKLVYVKYLDVLEKCLKRIAERKSSKDDLKKYSDGMCRLLIELEHNLQYLLSIIADEKKKDAKSFILNFIMNGYSEEVSIKTEKKTAVNADTEEVDCKMCSEVMDVEMSENPDESSLNLDCKSESEFPDVQVDSNGSKVEISKETDHQVNNCMNGEEDDGMIQSSTDNEGSNSQKKRKRESFLGMMKWLIRTAKNPCDPSTGCLPERSKWKSYGEEVPWKQVLSAREDLFLKQKFDSKADHEFWLRRQMLPSMYEGRTPERPRSSRKPTLADKSQLQDGMRKLSQTKCDYDDGSDRVLPRIGKKYQADLPEWDNSASESDFKWLGTKIWPLEKTEKRRFFERIPIGRGRQEDCGCITPSSVECVKFHISEKSARLKPELGSAFHYWRFDCMGENVTGSWTTEEENEFQAIVKEYHNFTELWDKLREAFPTRSRAAIVSYYFNVFLLRHRADQNRKTPYHIDSDMEDLESKDSSASDAADQTAENSRSSIYYSPKKPKKGAR